VTHELVCVLPTDILITLQRFLHAPPMNRQRTTVNPVLLPVEKQVKTIHSQSHYYHNIAMCTNF